MIAQTNNVNPTVAGAGVSGIDFSSNFAVTSNAGVRGASTNGAGVRGTSTNGAGVSASSENGHGIDASGDVGGVSASSRAGPGVELIGGTFDFSNGNTIPALSIVGNPPPGLFPTPDLIDACGAGQASPCESSEATFRVLQGGDVFITGKIFTAGSCSTGCLHAQNSVQEAVRLYTPQESLPTVEDFGEAQLSAGRAYVHIDSSFGDTIDQRAQYLVFITPEGDANTLFVHQKSSSGFAVTESRGGKDSMRSSIVLWPRRSARQLKTPDYSVLRSLCGPRTMDQCRS